MSAEKELDKIARHLINEGLVKTDDMRDDEVYDYVIIATHELRARITALEAQLAEAREVVKPFAERTKQFVFMYRGLATIDYIHLDRAAAWLAKQEQK